MFGLMFRAGLYASVPVNRDVYLLAGITPRYLAAVGDEDQVMPRTHHALQFSVGAGW